MTPDAPGAPDADSAAPTGSGGIVPGVLRGIDHVALAVRDADHAAVELTALLGLRITHDERLPDIGVRLVYLRTEVAPGDGALLQLVQPIAPCPVQEHIDRHGEGMHHVCFAVDDVDTAMAPLSDRDTGPVFAGGRGRRCAFLGPVPYGMRVELTERRPWPGAAGRP